MASNSEGKLSDKTGNGTNEKRAGLHKVNRVGTEGIHLVIKGSYNYNNIHT